MSRLQRIAAALVMGWLLAVGGSAPLFAQLPSPAEYGFWESIKTSSDPAEFRAYLEAYPKGFYAQDAQKRIAELEGRRFAAPTPPPPPPPPGPTPPPPSPNPSSTASVMTNYQTIREVQERLYNLNYKIRTINGQFSQETREAIATWQRNTNRNPTGDMTGDELAYLRTAGVITRWGAIAYEAHGASAVVWNRPSRQDAEREALEECRKRAGRNANNCDVLTGADTQCGALGFYTGSAGGRTHWGVFASIRSTLGQATDHALSECRRQAKVPSACGIRITFCADGSHKQ